MEFQHNVIGYLSADSGLAQSARSLYHHLSKCGGPVEGTCLSLGDDRTGRVDFKSPDILPGSHSIQWIHVNPPEYGDSWGANSPEQVQDAQAFKVGVPYWELERMPTTWIQTLNALDAVCAPTPFIAEAIRKSGVTAPVLECPLLFDGCSEEIYGDREKFSLPRKGFLFLTHFDLSSDPSRKNPEAAVEAFAKAFGPEWSGPEAHLVVVMNNPGKLEGADEIINDIQRKTHHISNIHWRSGHILTEDLKTFQASFDAVVSLHRAEGLGLVPLEMMAMGKPAVVTAYSGNFAYCTPQNSCLVPFDRVPVEAIHPVYLEALEEHPDLTWAEAQTQSAALQMQRLVLEPEWARRIGEQARRDVRVASSFDWSEFKAEVEALAGNTPSATAQQWEVRYSWCSCRWEPGLSHDLPWRTRWGIRWSNYKRKKGWNFKLFSSSKPQN